MAPLQGFFFKTLKGYGKSLVSPLNMEQNLVCMKPRIILIPGNGKVKCCPGIYYLVPERKDKVNYRSCSTACFWCHPKPLMPHIIVDTGIVFGYPLIGSPGTVAVLYDEPVGEIIPGWISCPTIDNCT